MLLQLRRYMIMLFRNTHRAIFSFGHGHMNVKYIDHIDWDAVELDFIVCSVERIIPIILQHCCLK